MSTLVKISNKILGSSHQKTTEKQAKNDSFGWRKNIWNLKPDDSVSLKLAHMHQLTTFNLLISEGVNQCIQKFIKKYQKIIKILALISLKNSL